MSQYNDKTPVAMFFCYAHKDEAFLRELQKHLKPLQRQKLVDTLWYDRDISAGMEWEREIDSHLNAAHIILLLISPDFMASDYCYSIEMQRAIERHERGDACVIPVILRPIYWRGSPFSNLQALPADGKPILSANWHNQDEAFFNIAVGIHNIVRERTAIALSSPPASPSSALEPKRRAPAVKKAQFILTRTLEGHSRLIRTVALSGDGRILASGSDDETVRLWSTVNGRMLHILGEHSGVVLSVTLSKNGQILASGGEDQAIRIWDVSTGTLRHTLEGHSGVVYVLALSDDGQMLVSGGSDRIVKIWDVPTGSLLHAFETPPPSFWIFSVALTADKQTAVSGRVNATIEIWDIPSKMLHHTLREHSGVVNAVAITLDGQTLVSGSDGQTVKIWDVASGRLLHTFKGHTDLVNAVAITSDGQMVVSGSHDQTIKVWDAAGRSSRQTLRGHLGRVFAVALSQDGQILASGSDDRTIRIWKKDG